MNRSSIKLDFQCPKKWESMTPAGSGRFCSDCKKIVTDFSKVPLDKLSLPEEGEPSCGNFYAFQLVRPFNNWKDRLVEWYQTAAYRSTATLSKQLTLLLMTLLLIATGCHRHVRGRIRVDHCKNKSHKHPTTQTALPPTGPDGRK